MRSVLRVGLRTRLLGRTSVRPIFRRLTLLWLAAFYALLTVPFLRARLVPGLILFRLLS